MILKKCLFFLYMRSDVGVKGTGVMRWAKKLLMISDETHCVKGFSVRLMNTDYVVIFNDGFCFSDCSENKDIWHLHLSNTIST